MKAEIARRAGQRERLKALFEARPWQDIEHAELLRLVGENFRSRFSELRKQDGMRIVNVERVKADGTKGYGAYRYEPQTRLGRDAAQIVTQKGLFS